MSDLTDFLLARIADDEAVLAALPTAPGSGKSSTEVREVHEFITRWNPQRAMSECLAKRAIVAQYEAVATSSGNDAMSRLEVTIRHLAGVYADHPDFREHWLA